MIFLVKWKQILQYFSTEIWKRKYFSISFIILCIIYYGKFLFVFVRVSVFWIRTYIHIYSQLCIHGDTVEEDNIRKGFRVSLLMCENKYVETGGTFWNLRQLKLSVTIRIFMESTLLSFFYLHCSIHIHGCPYSIIFSVHR